MSITTRTVTPWNQSTPSSQDTKFVQPPEGHTCLEVEADAPGMAKFVARDEAGQKSQFSIPTNGSEFDRCCLKLAREGNANPIVTAVHQFPKEYAAHMVAAGAFRQS